MTGEVTLTGLVLPEEVQLEMAFVFADRGFHDLKGVPGRWPLFALGAALLKTALKRRWVAQELDSRVLGVTGVGRRELQARFGLSL